MNPARRRLFGLTVGSGALLVAGAAVLWAATGRETFTRYFNAELAATDRPADPEADALLSSTMGPGDAPPRDPPLDNRFHMGLLPGGGGRHALSVAGVAALAGAAAAAAWVFARRKPATPARPDQAP